MEPDNGVRAILRDNDGLSVVLMPVPEVPGRLAGDELCVPGVRIPAEIAVDPDDVHVGRGLVNVPGLIHHDYRWPGWVQAPGVFCHRLEIGLQENGQPQIYEFMAERARRGLNN